MAREWLLCGNYATKKCLLAAKMPASYDADSVTQSAPEVHHVQFAANPSGNCVRGFVFQRVFRAKHLVDFPAQAQHNSFYNLSFSQQRLTEWGRVDDTAGKFFNSKIQCAWTTLYQLSNRTLLG